MVDNSPMTPQLDEEKQEQPRVSKPDGGLNDGRAAIAMMALAIALIVLVVILL